MAKKPKRNKPFDPAEAARIEYERRRNPERWGANEEALRLASNGTVQSEAETRTKTRRITRFDCFALLHQREGITSDQFTAVRRLQGDIAIRYRVDGEAGVRLVVDQSSSAEMVTARSLDAGKRVDEALAEIGPLSKEILLRLSEPEVINGQQVNWRAAVQTVTGEAHPHGQSALVRAACENLRMAYAEIDKQPRRAA